MKRIIISTVIAMSAAAAYADPVTVMTPKPGASAEEQAIYVAKLDKAASTVCKDTTRAVKNTGYVSYAECLKKARLEINKKDPTGLYAASKTAKPVNLASK